MWKKIVLGIVTGVFVLSVSAGSIYAYQKSSTGSNFCKCPYGDEEECDGRCEQNSYNNQERNCYMYENSSSSNCGNPDACGQQKQASNQERNCYSIMNRENYNQQESKNINCDTEGCGFNTSQGQKGKNK
jgi:hypothetical protein